MDEYIEIVEMVRYKPRCRLCGFIPPLFETPEEAEITASAHCRSLLHQKRVIRLQTGALASSSASPQTEPPSQ